MSDLFLDIDANKIGILLDIIHKWHFSLCVFLSLSACTLLFCLSHSHSIVATLYVSANSLVLAFLLATPKIRELTNQILVAQHQICLNIPYLESFLHHIWFSFYSERSWSSKEELLFGLWSDLLYTVENVIETWDMTTGVCCICWEIN